MSIIVTTTDSIDNRSIVQYIDVLKASVVVGTELALGDIIAGPTNKYRLKLDSIYDSAFKQLRIKAQNIGADAVVGLHTDFEEIFGKGKTRFVLSAVGTAVKLNAPTPEQQNLKGRGVPYGDLKRQQMIIALQRKLEKPRTLPDADDWDNIINFSLVDIAPLLYKRYLKLSSETISKTRILEKKLLLDNFVPFLQSIDYDSAAEIVYGDTTTAPYSFCDVVKACNLFHPSKILKMLQPENKHIVIALLDTDKPIYNLSDLRDMQQIAEYIDNLPDTGHYVEGRDGLFSKSGTLLVCERGHTSAVELGGHCTAVVESSSGAICNLNVKGITEKEVAAIRAFNEKIQILELTLNSQS